VDRVEKVPIDWAKAAFDEPIWIIPTAINILALREMIFATDGYLPLRQRREDAGGQLCSRAAR
jgi:hypothetical protein